MYVYVLLVGGKVHRQVGVVNVSHAMFDRNTGRRSLCASVQLCRMYVCMMSVEVPSEVFVCVFCCSFFSVFVSCSIFAMFNFLCS